MQGGRFRRLQVGIAVASSCWSLALPLHAAEMKVVTEYIYPTKYSVTPITGTDQNGNTMVVGGIVEPGGFETREVGASLVVEAYVGNLGDGVTSVSSLERKRMSGTTDLMIAATAGEFDKVRKLIAGGAAVNVRNRFGSTALMGACAGGFEDIVKLLLDNRADVNIRSKDGTTALMAAARNGHLSIVKALLEKGATFQEPDEEGQTPLLYAVKGGRGEIVELLVGKGANVNVADRAGQTPLGLASARKDESAVKLLTRLGAQR